MSSRNLFEFDKSQITSDVMAIVGTDEAGRGPGAGDVFSAAVYFPKVNETLIEKLSKLNESKQLRENVRES